MGTFSISGVGDGVNKDAEIVCDDFGFEPFCRPFDNFDGFGSFDKPFVIDVDCFLDFFGLSAKLESVVDVFFLVFFFLPFDDSPLVVGDV